ncbi:hypothetical protein GCM10025872_20180 [Barrientosiimonas endolithica]|uniref:Uncharacterized protein n=1 Tax=Barrientosiimonas endolithica TaxID=1535208 RepID=A0ABM8HBM7_9MICO|nr:hypothetical protein GCM10025872_20180 [Barrientosiimonas endolithica]
MNAGASTCGRQSWSNQVPPKVLTTVVSGANSCPQPGCPRRQMPRMPGWAPSTLAAMSATWVQVGLAGIVMPFAASTSLRYIRKEDSP